MQDRYKCKKGRCFKPSVIAKRNWEKTQADRVVFQHNDLFSALQLRTVYFVQSEILYKL